MVIEWGYSAAVSFQEAVTNIVRHAHAKKVTMRLHVEAGTREQAGSPHGLDRGRWPRHGPGAADHDGAAAAAWGLLGMRERIVQMGGTVDFTTGAWRRSPHRILTCRSRLGGAEHGLATES